MLIFSQIIVIYVKEKVIFPLKGTINPNLSLLISVVSYHILSGIAIIFKKSFEKRKFYMCENLFFKVSVIKFVVKFVVKNPERERRNCYGKAW